MMHDPKDDFLDGLFAEARVPNDAPNDDLMARVLADASAARPTAEIVPPSGSFLSGLLDLCGGWPALSGVAAAGVAGLWVGLAPPEAVEGWVAEMIGAQTELTLLPDLDGFDFSESFDG